MLTGITARSRSTSHIALALVVFLGSGVLARGQSVVLDTFDQGSTSGATLSGSSWQGQVVQNATSIQVGGTANDVNGWASIGLNLDASGAGYLRITAQRNSGHASPNVVVQFNDINLTQDAGAFSVGSDAFATDALTRVQIPIADWGSGFDPSQITDWSIGGGSTGLNAVRMTFEHLELASNLISLDGGEIITAGDQVYTTAQQLTASTVLGNTDGANNTGTAITFQSTVDGAHDLVLNTAGETTLASSIGGTTPLTSLTTDAGGTTIISGSITTTGSQTYNDEVQLEADSVFRAIGDGLMQFTQAIQGNGWAMEVDVNNWGTFGAAHGVSHFTKSGAGTFSLTGQSTFTGPTTVSAGTLSMGLDYALNAASSLTLSGGTLALNGHNLTLSALDVTGNAAIDFGSGSSALAFTSVAGTSWAATLSITNFNPTVNSLRFGTSSSGLPSANLSLFRFVDYGNVGGAIDAFGFITPVPEPSTWATFVGLAALGGAVARRRRRVSGSVAR